MYGQQLRILWVDDDQSLVVPYSNEAYGYGLYLTHCECWNDAENILYNNFDQWDAIILDAKCKHHKDSNPKADKFLTEAINAITRICAQKGRMIPWYILSAGGAEVGSIENNIPEERKKWDLDWDESTGRNYYLKTEDRETLYRRIYYYANNSLITQLRTLLYRDVFEALPSCQLDDEIEVYLEDLLLATIADVPNLKENDQLWKLRKCVEFILRSLIVKWQLLPAVLLDNTKKEKINLTSASFLLLGKDTKLGEKQYRLTISVDKIAAQNIYAIVQIAGSSLHTGKNDYYQTDEHLRSVNNAPYLVRSCILALCDIILWMRSFVQQYPNPKDNVTFVEEVPPVADTIPVCADETADADIHD